MEFDRRSVALLGLWFGCAIVTPVAAQESDAPNSLPAAASPSFPGASRPGWFVALGFLGANYEMDLQDTSRLESLGIVLDERGTGAALSVGYAFGRGFALELSLRGSDHPSGRSDVGASFGQIVLDIVAPLLPERRVQPYLAGGIGGVALVLDGPGFEDTVSGSLVDMGGGIEVHLSRRAALGFDYRYGIQKYQEQSIAGGTAEIDGTGTSHAWGTRFTWSF